MAHFAELDGTNTVLQVVVVGNDITIINDVENEQNGIDFLNGLFPESGTWVQTSYNAIQRHNYAGIGHIYDSTADAFHSPQPYSSWALDEDYRWQAPTLMPDDGSEYRWDEDTTSWVEVSDPHA